MKGITLFVVCAVALASGNQINGDPSEAPKLCSSADSDGVLVAHENCNQFYKCAHGVPVALNCPFDHLYNPEKEYCDWPSNVNCGERDPNPVLPRAKQGHSEPSQAASICSSEGSDGALVAHENCNQFYKCAYGKPVALDCPLNLLYNIAQEYCDWPSNVKCEGRLTPSAAVSRSNQVHSDPSQAASICSSQDSDGLLVAHENCNQFYKCAYGKPVALDCPSNLLYNIDQEYCDWPSNVKCEGRLTPSAAVPRSNQVHSDPSQAASICSSEDSDGLLVAHENCNQFYKCAYGKPVALDCPSNLLYNIDQEYCDWPANVQCGERQTPSKAVVRQASNVCASGYFGNVAHERCDAFYMCIAGHSIEIKCPLSLFYDTDKEVCNFASAVNCEGRITTSINKHKAIARQLIESSICSNSHWGHVVHERCDAFYMCIGGISVELQCPSTLMYDSELKVCNHASDVNCEGRLV